MKKILLILAVVSITVASCNCGCNYKYSVRHDGTTYYTNALNETDDGCVSFIEISANQTVRICGTYSVVVNPDWKPKTTQ